MKLNEDIISRLGATQNQIWQQVSMAVREETGASISFSDSLTVSSQPSELYGEMTSPKLIIQFSFAHLPEQSMVVLLPPDTIVDVFNYLSGEKRTSVDEGVVIELRPMLEAIVQGICLSVGSLRGDAVVASGLSIRYQIFAFPPNLQKVDHLARTNVRVSINQINGNLVWLMDAETASNILGVAVRDEDRPIEDLTAGHASEKISGALPELSDTGLELLMDIPLEISVELGRVKMVVKDVVELGSGSIVEIDKAAGEPVDVMVNGRLVARGEVVVIEDNFGVRITEILSPADRLAKLNEVA
ncbi:MAG: flagellar motor switch protein FliN [Fimbriimonadaceae bacterium]|jgi:flagellar motor switch protein FliN/FliY|nr:flagellar motor switch protein FliN [Fimbriimonadaceae bacterium]